MPPRSSNYAVSSATSLTGGAFRLAFLSAGRVKRTLRAAAAAVLALALAVSLVPLAPPTPHSALAASPAQAPVVTKQPVGGIFGQAATVKLYLQASSPDGGYLTYQWYTSSSATAAGTPLTGQTTSVCTFTSAATAGTSYVYAVVTNTKDSSTATTESAHVPVTVNKQAVHDADYASVKVDTARPLWTELKNGNFENTTGSSRIPSGYKDLPGWNATHLSPSGFTKAIELYPYSTYTSSPSKNGNGSWVAELASDAPSCLYQEIATVPGKIYQWQLDHAGRKGSSGKDVMAVVIGPAITEAESTAKGYGDKAADQYADITKYPYGHNTVTGTAVDKSYFADVTEALRQQNGGTLPTSGDYAVAYNGHTYYVYIASDARNSWGYHSGTYTVPEGQGASVFAFAYISSLGPGNGNILDNITFSTGGSIEVTDTVSYEGDGVLTVTSAKAGTAYGIVEERGSTVYPVSGVRVADGTGAAVSERTDLGAGTLGWYTLASDGSLAFSNLTPGKRYRVVGIPLAAINTTTRANLTPSLVLDSDYYRSFTIKAVSDGSGGSGGNIQATAESTPDGNCEGGCVAHLCVSRPHRPRKRRHGKRVCASRCTFHR